MVNLQAKTATDFDSLALTDTLALSFDGRCITSGNCGETFVYHYTHKFEIKPPKPTQSTPLFDRLNDANENEAARRALAAIDAAYDPETFTESDFEDLGRARSHTPISTRGESLPRL